MYQNMTLGPGTLYIKNEPIGPIIPELNIDYPPDDTQHIRFPLHTPEPIEFELESTVDIPTLSILTGEEFLGGSKTFSLQYTGTRLEQVRKHKKKRINKKWAKRYGYREVSYTWRIDDARLLDTGDGSFEFRKEY